MKVYTVEWEDAQSHVEWCGPDKELAIKFAEEFHETYNDAITVSVREWDGDNVQEVLYLKHNMK